MTRTSSSRRESLSGVTIFKEMIEPRRTLRDGRTCRFIASEVLLFALHDVTAERCLIVVIIENWFDQHDFETRGGRYERNDQGLK